VTRKASYQRKEPDHGTPAGYQWHRRHKVPPCDPCRVAHNEYTAEQHRNRYRSLPKRAKVNRKTEVVRIPLDVFAEMYWTASPKALRMLDREFGRTQVDEMIKRADEICP
jgi:hypothetical protein